ncbi:MAG: beta-lactamase class [Mucilaginibacter sp.]|nr:beta-lactamase class [Mucilaginibacter sp.]
MRYYCVMKKVILLFCLIFVFLVPVSLQAQQNSLRDQIVQIAKPTKGIVGVSILNIENGDTVNYNGGARLVMQSVMKFPIALTILHWVDSGKISLTQLIHLKRRDLPKNTFSPLRDKYPKGNVDISFAELLRYTVSLSDNNACDILLSVLGGTKPVQDYMLHLGIKNIAINASEAEMASAWEVQYTNWCKPLEMTQLLDRFYKGKVLTKTNTDFLYNLMTETATGPNRIKSMLPAGTVVAHKTGSSGTNKEGLTPATNDVGIITLPNGKHIAISVFVCNSTDDEATREGVIAKIAKAAYEFYNH